MMVRVGALVTLDLPAGAPALSMPWIITFGPLSDDEDWEPVVVGPYERPHALALAEEIVADEDLMAVVEPLLPHTSVDEIRAEIAAAMQMSTEEEDIEAGAVLEYDAEVDEDEEGTQERREPPTPEEIRAGFARIAAKLTGPSFGGVL
jgi:hypothetical protein